MWNEIKKIKSRQKDLRDFGLTMGVILVILGGVALWRAKPAYYYFFASGAVFTALGLIAPAALKPFQKIWIALGMILGFFVSRIVLAVLFYACMTPIGIFLRIIGKDVLDQRIDKKSASYWIQRKASVMDKSRYENQY